MKRDIIILRGAIVFSSIVYIAVFNWTYLQLVAPTYYFYGFSTNLTPRPYLILSWIICLIPSLWMRIRINRPSLFFFLIQYYIIFIPACFILYNTSKPDIPAEKAINIILVLFCGLSILQAVYYMPLIAIKNLKISSSLFWYLIFSSMFMFIGYIAVSFMHNYRLANFEEIYSVRLAFADAVKASGTRFGLYAQMWLSGFFFPFCTAVGLETKHKWLIVLAAAGYFFVFGITGNKTTLFAFVYIPAIYFWLKCTKKYTVPIFVLGLSCLLFFGVLACMIGLDSLAYWYIAVVNFRTFSIPAQIIGQFYAFFDNHPLTHMSHVTGINYFIPYPYDMDIPRLVGIYFYGGPVGLNAGFWAGDGISGFGLPGIIIMSVVCGIVFWIFDSVASRLEPRFVIIASTFIATTFANVSLFTTIISGGLVFLLMTLYVLPNEGILYSVFKK